MVRLKRDLINKNKSRLGKDPRKLFSKESKIKFNPTKIYKALLDKRGGEFNPKFKIYFYKLLYEFVFKFQKVI